MKRRRTVRRKPRRRRKTQKGGLLPLAALIPALVAAGKAAALGVISGAAGYGGEKGFGSCFANTSKMKNKPKTKKRHRQRGGARPRRKHDKRQRGGALLTVLKNAAKIGYKLGKDKKYKRMGAKGVTGSYDRRPAPWEV